MSLILPSFCEYKDDSPELVDGNYNLYAKLFSSELCTAWIQEFGKLSSTRWILRNSKAATQRIVFRRDYVCHHNPYGKSKSGDRKSKNLNCEARISIVMEKYNCDPFPAKITIRNIHSHPINNAQVLSWLPGSTETRAKYEEHFNNGMGITEAINFHMNKIEILYDEVELADASVNPKYRTVRHWYDVWRQQQLGPRTGMGVFEKLGEKQAEYEKTGVTIKYQEDPFIIIIVTNIMKRAREFARDIVFVDSTASCDADHHSITFMLTCTQAGAVPLAVIITKGQTMQEYEFAFRAIRQLMGNAGFGGRAFPRIFMTDDSDAERGALRTVFPESTLLLCLFHVGQAVWRWLVAKEHNIHMLDRQHLYHLFKNMIVASSDADVENSHFILTTDSTSAKYENWLEYVGTYWRDRQSWCLAYRDTTTHGNQTNNYAEINVRIYKDNVLSRCRAYNVVALVDFTSCVLEEYYTRRLRNYANGRTDKDRLIFQKTEKKSAYLKRQDITKMDSNNFLVPSEKETAVTYEVDVRIGSCTCEHGRLGNLCKHLVGVWVHYLGLNSQGVYLEDRYAIAKLALGDKANTKDFYAPLQASHTPDVSQSAQPQPSCSTEERRLFATDTPPCGIDPSCSTEASQENWTHVKEVLTSKIEKFGCNPLIYERWLQRLQKVNSRNALETCMATFGSSIQVKQHRRAAIHVQPTAISRRRAGVTRGSKRLPGGRPAVGEPKRKKKRPHNLSLNIAHNVPNATMH